MDTVTDLLTLTVLAAQEGSAPLRMEGDLYRTVWIHAKCALRSTSALAAMEGDRIGWNKLVVVTTTPPRYATCLECQSYMNSTSGKGKRRKAP